MTRYLAMLLLICGLSTATPAAAHPPYGLVTDKAGNAYFSDLETVWRLAPDGRLAVFRLAVPETHVHALTMAPDGAIEGDQNHYDPQTQRFYSGLWRRTLAGAERAIVPMTERPPPGAGVWQDRAGNRYATQWPSNADRRTQLLRRRPNGGGDVLFDETGGKARRSHPSVESLGGMAFGADGSLFFADRGLLRRMAPDGTVSKVYDGGTGSSLRGLAVAPDGRVLAADMGTKQVLAVSADGRATPLYRETAAWSPTAVALAAGRLLVLEANADPYDYVNRVRVVEVDKGKGRVVATPGLSGPTPAPQSSAPPAADRSIATLVGTLLAAGAVAAAALTLRRRRSRPLSTSGG